LRRDDERACVAEDLVGIVARRAKAAVLDDVAAGGATGSSLRISSKLVRSNVATR
jgi:hypothetical protein